MHVNWLMWLEVVAFLAITFLVGIITKKWVKKSEDFFLGGRQLHWLVIGLMTSAIVISGAMVTAAAGYGYNYGVGGIWPIMSWGIACIGAGILLSPYWRRAGTHTIPEWYEMNFGIRTRMVFSALYVLCTMLAAVCQVVGLGITLSAVTGIPYQMATWVCGAIYLGYILLGGIWATAVNSVIEAMICILGMFSLIIYLSAKVIPLNEVYAALPPDMLSFPGKLGWGPFVYLSFGGLLWGNIACIWPQQYYYINAIGARSERHAIKGFVVAGILAILCFAWTLPAVGVYGRALFPDIAAEASFGEIIKILPTGLNGFVLLVVLAGAMSTACPQILGTANLVTKEFYQRFHPESDEVKKMHVTRWLTLFFGVLIVLIGSIFSGSSSMMLGIFFAISAPLLPSTLAIMFWRRTTKESCAVSVLVGLAASVIWMLFGNPALAHASWVGAAVSAIVLVVIALLTQHKSWWQDGVPVKAEESLTEEDARILKFIQNGWKKQALLLDLSGGDSVALRHCLDKLLLKGLVERDGNIGKQSMIYHLTDDGRNILGKKEADRDLCEEDRTLLRELLSMSDDMNSRIAIPDLTERLVKALPSEYIVPLMLNLADKGLVKEHGLFKVSFSITAKGRQLLSAANAAN